MFPLSNASISFKYPYINIFVLDIDLDIKQYYISLIVKMSYNINLLHNKNADLLYFPAEKSFVPVCYLLLLYIFQRQGSYGIQAFVSTFSSLIIIIPLTAYHCGIISA